MDGFLDGYNLKKFRRKRGELERAKLYSGGLSSQGMRSAKPRKGGSHLLFLPSFPGEETFPIEVSGEGPAAAVGPFVF